MNRKYGRVKTRFNNFVSYLEMYFCPFNINKIYNVLMHTRHKYLQQFNIVLKNLK